MRGMVDLSPGDVFGPDGHAAQRQTARLPDRGGGRRTGRDRRGLTDAAHAVWRVRVGVLEYLALHRWHVENGRDQVVGERRVPDHAVLHYDLLHQGEAHALRAPALDMPDDGGRAARHADVLPGVECHAVDRPEFAIDIHHRT